MGTVTAGWFNIREHIPGPARRDPIEVDCYLGENPPKVTEGYAIWEQITRPKRKSVTEWQGARPMKVTVEIIIDYFNSAVSSPGLKCERDMRNLELLAGATEKNLPAEHPPLVRWDANAMHDDRHAGHVLWVIESLTWGDVLYNETPNAVRASATLVLMEWVEDEYIRASGSKKNRSKKSSGKKKKSRKGKSSTYRVTIADTQNQGLRTIAKKLVGDAKRWREIAKIQKPPIRDPMAIRPDQILKRPKGW